MPLEGKKKGKSFLNPNILRNLPHFEVNNLIIN